MVSSKRGMKYYRSMTTLRLLPKFLASLVLLPLATFVACSPETREFGSGGTGGTSSSSSGMPTGMMCTTDSECGASSECQSFACIDNGCLVSFGAKGTAVALQQAGDCLSKICDGAGVVVDVPDAADPADDGNACTLDACVGNETQHGFLMAGTTCNGTQYCDGFGYCVECLDSSQCSSGVCVMNTCATAQCSDAVKNGAETDVDCGGPECPLCPAGFACIMTNDCKSQVCDSGICAAPTCTDNTQNGQETYFDCGGPDCLPCKSGVPCNAGIDCASGICTGNLCQDAACDDSVKNGDESDIDCGGTICPKCPLGRACDDASDCISNDCCVSDPMFPGYCKTPGGVCEATIRTEMQQ
jgi:hypothetical protein